MATARPLAQTLGAPRSVQGIAFNAGTQLFFGLDNELVLSVIPDDQVIADVPCKRGLVHFHPCGRLAQATLADDFAHLGHNFPARTHISWNEDGTLSARLPTTSRVSGVPLPDGTRVWIDDAGKLRSFSRRLDQAETIAGIPCQASSIVTCYGDGRVQRLTLAVDHAFDGLLAMASTDVELHANGKVAVLILAEATQRAQITFDAGTTLVLRHDGTLSVAQLAAPHDVAGKRYPEGSYLRFDANEALTSGVAITWTVNQAARS